MFNWNDTFREDIIILTDEQKNHLKTVVDNYGDMLLKSCVSISDIIEEGKYTAKEKRIKYVEHFLYILNAPRILKKLDKGNYYLSVDYELVDSSYITDPYDDYKLLDDITRSVNKVRSPVRRVLEDYFNNPLLWDLQLEEGEDAYGKTLNFYLNRNGVELKWLCWWYGLTPEEGYLTVEGVSCDMSKEEVLMLTLLWWQQMVDQEKPDQLEKERLDDTKRLGMDEAVGQLLKI